MEATKKVYSQPESESIAIQIEQCIANSPDGTLKDMDGNEVYDEDF